MENRQLVYYSNPGEAMVDNHSTLEDYIERAKKRGDETYQIKTPDGFVIYERYYKENPDGSKKIVAKSYLKKNELTPKEAAEAMLKGERLIDFKNPPDVAQYKWDGENFVVYDSYYRDRTKVLKKFNGLKIKDTTKEQDLEREKIRVKEYLGFELDLSDLPMVNRQCGLTGALWQAVSMCRAHNWELTKEHVYSVLANYDSDLQGMFS